MIILDEPVRSKEEVNALGIRHGDLISIDPRCQTTPNGYLKSRFIDDKAGVACCLVALLPLNISKNTGLSLNTAQYLHFPM